jgi:hypothetical protein
MRLAHILQRQRYRLHLRLVALCQAISLGIPITRKSNSKVTPNNKKLILARTAAKIIF